MQNERYQQLFDDNPNRWLVSYADFMTLLFAFFVVMYAVSSMSVQHYKVMAKKIEHDFKRHRLYLPSHILPITLNTNTLADHQQQPAVVADTQEDALNQLPEQLDFIDNREALIREHKNWIEIEFKSKALFPSGRATLGDNAITMLEKLAATLKNNPYFVAVEGHTDSQPIRTNRFPSNWELSAARSAAVARVLAQAGVSAKRLSAIGYGQQFPVADNQTRDGRTSNRRVTLIIAKNNSVQRLLNPEASPEIKRQATLDHLRATTKVIPVIKEIRTPDGGIKFIREFKRVKKSPGE